MVRLIIFILLCCLASLIWNMVIFMRISKEDKEIKQPKKKTTDKKDKYLDFVYLSKDEYQKLIEYFWDEEKVKKEIVKLNDYIGKSWKKYKSHYYTIRSWNPDLQEKIQPSLFERKAPMTKLQMRKGEIILLHNARWSNIEIAERIGCTPQGISSALKRWWY